MTEQPAGRRPGKTSFVVLVMVFVVPVILATMAYLYRDHISGTTNRGDLVIPARPLPEVVLHGPDGEALPAEALRGKWTLVYVGPAACDAVCRDNLYKTRQIRIAQNEEMYRVQRLWLITDPTGLDTQGELLAEHKGLALATGVPEAVLESFRLDDGAAPGAVARVYIVDPLGNLMMSYEPGFEPKDLLKDLAHLLKVSRIG